MIGFIITNYDYIPLADLCEESFKKNSNLEIQKIFVEESAQEEICRKRGVLWSSLSEPFVTIDADCLCVNPIDFSKYNKKGHLYLSEDVLMKHPDINKEFEEVNPYNWGLRDMIKFNMKDQYYCAGLVVSGGSTRDLFREVQKCDKDLDFDDWGNQSSLNYVCTFNEDYRNKIIPLEKNCHLMSFGQPSLEEVRNYNIIHFAKEDRNTDDNVISRLERMRKAWELNNDQL